MTAYLRAFFTFAGFSVLAIAFLGGGGLISQVIAGLIFIGGIRASMYVYKLVKTRPASDLYYRATPDLDNLKPIPGSGIIEITPEKLAKTFDPKSLNLIDGYLKIWGDWQNKSLDTPKSLDSIHFNKKANKLSFHFENGTIQVINPRVIHMAGHFIKILYADKVLWNWGDDSTLIYYKDGNEIIRETNVDLVMDEFDVDPSQPALLFR